MNSPAPMLYARVLGIPAPQGSKKFVGRGKGGHGIMVESSKKVAPWRDSVALAVAAARTEAPAYFDGAVRLTVTFVMPRKGEAANWTRHHTRAPDLDKLVRSTCDAITTSGAWKDDSCVVELMAVKVSAEPGESSGCVLIIEALPEKEKPRAKAVPRPKATAKTRQPKTPAGKGEACPYFV